MKPSGLQSIWKANAGKGLPFLACVALLFVVVVCLGGCTSSDRSKDSGHYAVRVSKTPMFRYGPAQSFGADFNLIEGQHVVMLRREFGYSRVMTDDGQSGYVATEDLRPTTPPAPAKPNVIRSNTRRRPNYANVPPLPPSGTSRPGISSANNQILQNAPLFAPGDLPPLPDPDGASSGDNPSKLKPESHPKRPKPQFRGNVPDRETPPAESKETQKEEEKKQP